ncbi:MAG: 2Fe-2S iron-sulfur cluster-binding protein [Hydrotalea sp.]|nr:2Fe-2S iron-sulfur cluster-binding protein [Hydrotalea sp.]
MKIKKDKPQTPTAVVADDSLRVAPQQLGAGRPFGVAVDTRRPVAFFLDGKKYLGFHGDNVAAALLANQQKFLAGSLLYHRPRGMLADKFYESNGFVAIGDKTGNNHRHGFEPAMAVGTLPLIPGARFYRTRHPDKFSSIQFFNKTREVVSAMPKPISQPARLSKNLGNRLARAVGTSDVSRDDINQLRDDTHRALGLMNGFTGKNFATTSGGFWTDFLRQMMGYAPAPLVNPAFQYMGRDTATQVFYDNQFHQYDVVVVGGGVDGALALQSLMAKLGKSSVSIALISNETDDVTMAKMSDAIGKASARLRLDPRISWFFSTTAVTSKKLKGPASADKTKNAQAAMREDIIEITANSHHTQRDNHAAGEVIWREQHHVFHCRAVILATGKSEQLLPFDNNDLPGIMGFGNAVKLLKIYGVKPGHHAVIITNNDSVYHHLDYLHSAGVSVSAVIDIRKNINPALRAMAQAAGAEVFEFYYPKRARALYSQSAPTIFPRSIGKAIKMLGRVVRTDNPTVASLLAVQQLDEDETATPEKLSPEPTAGEQLSTTKNLAKNATSKKQKQPAELYVAPQASKIVLARPDQTDEALSAETEKIFNSDCLLVSGGFQPRLSLFTQLLPKDKREGDFLTWVEPLQAYLPKHWPSQVFLVGAAGGCFVGHSGHQTDSNNNMAHKMANDVASEIANLLEGKSVGKSLSKSGGKKSTGEGNMVAYHHGLTIMPHRFLPDTQHLGRNSFIDHQYDVKLEHIHGSFAAGYHTPFAIKHYSKLGFGFDRGQGGLSLALAYLYGNKVTDAATTMQNIIQQNNIFGELHGMAHPTALGALAHLPLDGRQFFNQVAVKEEMPLYPLTHRPKFFNVIMHPENNLSNDHGAQTTVEDGKKIANYYPYHAGDEAEEESLEEKQNILNGIGFADGSAVTTIKIIGKRAIDFLQFLSATKISNSKVGAAGGVTLLNPRDGLILARGRYMVRAADMVILSLPLRLPAMNQPTNNHQVAQFITHLARVNRFALGIIDDSEQSATLRLVGRGVALLLSQFYNGQLIEKTIEKILGKNAAVKKSFTKDEKENLDQVARQLLIKNLPLNQAQQVEWRGFSFLLSRRRFLPAYYIGGMVADVEITCQADQAVALYQQLWHGALAPQNDEEMPAAKKLSGKKSAGQPATTIALGDIIDAMGYRPFGLGRIALDYWRMLKGDGAHGTVGEIDGGHSLYDSRLNDAMRDGKFSGRDEASKDFLGQKNRERLCGFIAATGAPGTNLNSNFNPLVSAGQQAIIRAGSIVQEIDKEPLAQGHGIGRITSATYCPIRKKYIALGFVRSALDPLSGKWKDPFGQEVMIADPLFKNYQRAIIVPYHQLGLPEAKE